MSTPVWPDGQVLRLVVDCRSSPPNRRAGHPSYLQNSSCNLRISRLTSIASVVNYATLLPRLAVSELSNHPTHPHANYANLSPRPMDLEFSNRPEHLRICRSNRLAIRRTLRRNRRCPCGAARKHRRQDSHRQDNQELGHSFFLVVQATLAFGYSIRTCRQEHGSVGKSEWNSIVLCPKYLPEGRNG